MSTLIRTTRLYRQEQHDYSDKNSLVIKTRTVCVFIRAKLVNLEQQYTDQNNMSILYSVHCTYSVHSRYRRKAVDISCNNFETSSLWNPCQQMPQKFHKFSKLKSEIGNL